jgi:hypothetical protein
LDAKLFLQTSVSTQAGLNTSLRLHGRAGGDERLQVGPVTAYGRIAAALRSVLHITSPEERRAAQSFVEAIRREYGSSGTEALRRMHISEDKPLKLRQVRDMLSIRVTTFGDGIALRIYVESSRIHSPICLARLKRLWMRR